MEPILLVAILLVVLVATVTPIAVSRRRARRLELEPPPRPGTRPPRVSRPAATRPPEAPRPGRVPGATPVTPPEPAAVEPEVAEPDVAEPEVVEAEVLEPEVLEAEVLEAEPDAEVGSRSLVLERPRFRDRLGKARSLLAGYVTSVRAQERITDDTWDELEEALIRSDVGVALTSRLLTDLQGRVKREGIASPDALVEALKDDLKKSLASADRGLRFEPGAPNVWLFVGVNGVGKTTTVAKVAAREAGNGRAVVLAAGDTFRAAAAEQLATWAERVGADLVRGAEGGDPGSVVFDAVERAAARDADLVLADTAGRLHTKVNLMEELKKVRRIAERPPARLTEVLLVLDATTGQNGLTQAKQFTDAVGVTGVVLTKLDGSAKGGIALAIQTDLGLPIKLVGLGEGAGDLVDFDPDEFVEALFS